jgi:diguanylate cyclase (GGDEF)-like protein/PAS domain S-box-containing protein
MWQYAATLFYATLLSRYDFCISLIIKIVLLGISFAIIIIPSNLHRLKMNTEIFKVLPDLALKLVENSIEGIVITDETGVIQFVNEAFAQISGYSAEEAIGQTPRILKSGKHDQDFYEKMWASLVQNGAWKGEIWNKRKNGDIYPQRLSIISIENPSVQGKKFFASVISDLTQIKHDEEELRHRADHDVLTNLPNRYLFHDRMTQAVNRARRSHAKFAVLFIDIDDFKKINDRLGHDAGDMILREVTMRLVQCGRDVDTVSRVGGDEFTFILEGVSEDDVGIIAARITERMRPSFSFYGKDINITVSVGIAMYPQNGKSVAEIMKNADMAMYHAKGAGKNRYFFFTHELNEKAIKSLELEINLREAIKNRDMIAYYQPKIDMASGEIVGMEALARWPRFNERPICPDEFIPVAEHTGMIGDLDMIIFERACGFTRQIKTILNGDMNSFRVSVNLSAKNIESKGFLGKLISVVEKLGLDPKDVEFEVTESVIVGNIASAKAILNSLSDDGFSISIDDFGTGYSSLAYLMQFPISTLKIDKSFIRNLSVEPKALSIATAIVGMAHSIGIKTVAEGVESVEQLDFLRNMGCDQIQGYIFSRPLPEDEMADLITSGKTFAS